MKQAISTFLLMFLLSVLPPVNNVLAHNGIEEKKGIIHLYDKWNFVLAGLLLIIFVLSIIQVKKGQESLKKCIYLFLALLTFYIAIGSPLHYLGDHFLFSAHMLEQSLIYIVLPPLLLLGLPNRMMEPILHLGFRYKLINFLKYPLIPLLLFNVLFSFYHVPFIFNTIVSNNILHNLTHIILTISALFMWIPLIPVTKELDRLANIQKIGYIFAAGILLTPACALIIFANQPFYTVYYDAPQLFKTLTPLKDQQTGGIIMKVVQEIVYGTIIGYIFFNWAKKERLKDEQLTGSFVNNL